MTLREQRIYSRPSIIEIAKLYQYAAGIHFLKLMEMHVLIREY